MSLTELHFIDQLAETSHEEEEANDELKCASSKSYSFEQLEIASIKSGFGS
jgi:hypothetical protein